MTPQSFMDGCARSVAWLLGSALYVFVLARLAGHSHRRLGILSIGFGVLMFAWAAGRPPFVTALRYHQYFRWFGTWRKDDYMGEAYVIVLGLGFLLFGLYQLLSGPAP